MENQTISAQVTTETRAEDLVPLIDNVSQLSSKVLKEAIALRDYFRGNIFGNPSMSVPTDISGYYCLLEHELLIIQDNLYEIERCIEATK